MKTPSAVRTRLPLATRIIVRLLLNLLVVVAAFTGLLVLQVRLNPGWLLAGTAGERFRTVAEMMSADLALSGPGGEAELVAQYEAAYDLEFRLFDPAGRELTGRGQLVPREVRDEVLRARGAGPGRERVAARRAANALADRPTGELREGLPPEEEPGAGDLRGYRRGGALRRERDNAAQGSAGNPAPGIRGGGLRINARDAGAPRAILRAGEPRAYWIILPLPPHAAGPGPILVARASSLWSGGMLFDPFPWLLAGAGALALSIVFWLPFVRNITRDIGRLTRQTESIAAGRFETRLDLDRRDELGRLAEAIDQMAERLAGHVAGQRRFLGDAAHELSSPIARMQAAVAILESPGLADRATYLADLREELDEMAALVQELLAFSRATHGRAPRLEPVELRRLVDRAWQREGGPDLAFENRVPETSVVLADGALLQRAVANLLRNAIRHAGKAGPILAESSSEPSAGTVELSILDSGPGVPPESVPRLFEPFFRPEDARTRDTGGAGLGLSIVKTCVDACRGTVAAYNRTPVGFGVTLRLPAAPGRPPKDDRCAT